MTVRSGATARQSVPGGAEGWRGRLGACLRRLGLSLATGYIFLFFAERVFWSRWRDGDDNAGAFLATWLVYSIGGAICLAAVQSFRVRDIWPMFLVGALLGWLVEGVFTMTFFGAGGIPFPYTIAWTGLSWHALLTVVVGWYGLQTALLHSFRRTAWISAALGLFWGGWSIFWDIESPPGPEQLFMGASFLTHAFTATLALLVAFRAAHYFRSSRFRPSRIENAALAAMVGLWFLCVTVVQFNWLALVTLPPLFAVIYLSLRRNAATETRPDFLEAIDRRFPWRHGLAIFLMPALAGAIHEGCRLAELSAQVNVVVFAVTMPVGTAGFLLSLWKVFRRRPDRASVANR